MEDLFISNLANDTTEEEILAIMGLDGTTYLRKNNLARRQYTDNGRFSGCIHDRMPQQFIDSLKINGLSFKNRDLAIQPLTEMMKLQQSGKRNNYTPYGGLSFRAKQGGKWRRNGILGEEVWLPHVRQQQPRPNGQTPPKQGDKTGSSNLTQGAPGQKEWVDIVDAPVRTKTLRGG